MVYEIVNKEKLLQRLHLHMYLLLAVLKVKLSQTKN